LGQKNILKVNTVTRCDALRYMRYTAFPA